MNSIKRAGTVQTVPALLLFGTAKRAISRNFLAKMQENPMELNYILTAGEKPGIIDYKLQVSCGKMSYL